jgi:hypothetical protein
VTSALEAKGGTGRPVFLLAAGGRTGSTLVQRLLISTGEIMVWGEHGGLLLDAMQRVVYGMREWIEREKHWQDFLERRAKAWIPNINPPHEAFVAAARGALLRALAEPAAELGYPRWGFKEVRYNGSAIALLRMLFPDAIVVVLLRHPVAMLESIKSAPWYKRVFDARPELFLGDWAQLSTSLVRAAGEPPGALVLRHEELAVDPQGFVRKLAQHVQVDAGRFDTSLLDTRERGMVGTPSPLDEGDRAALESPDVQRAASALGYRLDERFAH